MLTGETDKEVRWYVGTVRRLFGLPNSICVRVQGIGTLLMWEEVGVVFGTGYKRARHTILHHQVMKQCERPAAGIVLARREGRYSSCEDIGEEKG